ncbi:hypothetical protein KVT40_000443 [Elsinoe batatas]|uniref:Pentafunctional AROM polypeptide n=1 Tax=Elsinoe batatas TaxID=2601811 RepID=A0A8K0PL52_9PEZI|nr:hypothetical protein KVT40_000443 [Elsinoe batatas]
MATTEVHLQTSLAPSSAETKTSPVVHVEELEVEEEPNVVVLFEHGQDHIVLEIASVLGQPWSCLKSEEEAGLIQNGTVIGISDHLDVSSLSKWKGNRTVLSTHCLDESNRRVASRTSLCDYEYLYTSRPFYRRDLARFLALVLGQSNPHRELKNKKKTTLISTTFPDVHAALPNLDILSVGADAVELRVDLLEDKQPDGSHPSVPSLQYAGEQLMLLRQRTELPIIFTTRCTNENGRFPMDRPELFFEYLHKAIQWGCEYIDVELWLPEEIRKQLSDRKAHSKIISAFHDFSGNFKWTSPEAQRLFERGAVYGDVVKMIALVSSMQENYELEYFRSIIQTTYPYPPFSGLNMGPMGQLSRALNKIFTPITHPLLPLIAAPGQLSAAEINAALHTMGQLPRLDVYGIGSVRATGQAMFYEKCFNELSLPHHLICIDREASSTVEHFIGKPNFGGAHLNPPLPANAASLPSISNAAMAIGQIDTIYIQTIGNKSTLTADNATWKAIRATLCRDFVPTAYRGQAALVLASHESQAAAVIFALKSLSVETIYTIGFRATGPLADLVEPFKGVEDLKKNKEPAVVVSALRADKSLVVNPLLKHYRAKPDEIKRAVRVFVDLTNGGPRKGDPEALATSLGWTAYGMADVNAWTTVETLRLLVGQNVPYDFVRLASGRSLY